MSASENKKPVARDYVEDPELPLDRAPELSAAERETARRQRYLDNRLRAAMADLHRQVDRRQPDADSFMLRLQNQIEAYDRQSAASAARNEGREASAYLARIAWRRRIAWLRERLLPGEHPGWQTAAAALVLALFVAPILYYGQAGSGAGIQLASDEADESTAMSGEREEGSALAQARSLASGADADGSSDRAGDKGEQVVATAAGSESPEGESAAREEARVAAASPTGGKAAVPAPDASAGNERADEEPQVAMRSREFAMSDQPEDAPAANAKAPAPSPVELQVAILSERLKKAETSEEKLLILKGLRSLYEKSGQAGKVREMDRKIEALLK